MLQNTYAVRRLNKFQNWKYHIAAYNDDWANGSPFEDVRISS